MSALGKGLGSLIPSRRTKDNYQTMRDDFNFLAEDNQTTSQKIQQVPLQSIKANPWQPRTNFARESLEELAESIKEHGILQPLLVSREGDGYQLIAGERRWRAAELLHLKEVPVIIKEDVSSRDKLELSIVENIQRRDLNPLETANAYKRLKEEFGLSYDAIAEKVGKGLSTIANFLRLLDLPPLIQEALGDGQITFSHAKIILSYPTKTEQLKIFKTIIRNELNVKQLEELTKKASFKTSKKDTHDPVLASWEDKITKKLGAKTTINKRGERGQIKIQFFSHAELKNILEKLE
jgi:ParB family chromosome partitioning protein